ncbi:hypothetical protein BV22DRAFT_787151 [Leucogyrophana mollusca]|uniref:Uncharacterized protein n=1 Tax=Leucogyrophana mollusca TaxID=85980 RepID=A0ACB8B4P2_9AGAM|nr:hypothetical protein BV22DRAFT_787151 [Leucogyrophana mollusca]
MLQSFDRHIARALMRLYTPRRHVPISFETFCVRQRSRASRSTSTVCSRAGAGLQSIAEIPMYVPPEFCDGCALEVLYEGARRLHDPLWSLAEMTRHKEPGLSNLLLPSASSSSGVIAPSTAHAKTSSQSLKSSCAASRPQQTHKQAPTRNQNQTLAAMGTSYQHSSVIRAFLSLCHWRGRMALKM